MTSNSVNGDCIRATLDAPDGHRILVDSWTARDPHAIVQILHGLSEHPARYERFAVECNRAGLHVVAHSHRGHGENCERDNLGHFADENGWNEVVNDARLVQLDALNKYRDLPLVMLGHSMGSCIAQSYMMRHPENVSALILSGSTYASRLQLRMARLLTRIESWRHGSRGKSELLQRLGLGKFNRAFAPNRTESDWLSRDPTEVDRFVADPLCGALPSCQLWHDLTGGMLEITAGRAIQNIPRELPILIAGGELDPVGGARGMTRLAEAYRSTGHADVTLTIYPQGRHEMLNEINRGDVTRDLIHWITDKIAQPDSTRR